MSKLKQLSQNQMIALDTLKKEVEQRKRQKQKQKIRQQQKNKQSDDQGNITNYLVFQADRYVRLCYLTIRQALYGSEQDECKQLNLNMINSFMDFYTETYQKQPSNQLNPSKIKIYQPINDKQLIDLFNNQLIIVKIQVLAQQTHKNILNYFKIYGQEIRQHATVQTSSTTTSQANISQQNQAPIPQNQVHLDENLIDSLSTPLLQIIQVIQKEYPWDHWGNIRFQPIQQNGQQLKERYVKLMEMNFYQVLAMSYLTKNLQKLASQNQKFYESIKKVLEQFSIKKKEQQREKQQSKTKKQKSYKKQKDVEKLQQSSVKQIVFIQQPKIEQIAKEISKQQQTQQSQLIEQPRRESDHLEEIRHLKQIIEKDLGTQSAEQKLARGRLKEKIQQFNYGLLGSQEIRNLKYERLHQDINVEQVIDYVERKQLHHEFLHRVVEVYEELQAQQKY